jgi:hypothetical protein
MGYADASSRRTIVTPLLVAALLFLGSIGSAFAQTAADVPATKEDVERYFQAIHSHDMMQKMMEAMSKPMHRMTHDQCEKDKDKLPADCETQINKMMDDMMKELPMDEMMQAMVPAYQKHFTKGDMDALVAFYSAPIGQKILQEMPAIMSEAMEDMMPIMRKSIDKMTERAQQQVAQMMKDSPRKKGADAPPTKN